MRLRALSYNIHKCIGGIDRRYQPERVIATIAHYAPDLVMLQEVDAGAKRSGGHRQADMLAEALGLRHHAWFPNVFLRSGGAYGNAVLSRFPCRTAFNMDLSLAGRKARSVLHTVVRIRVGSRSRTVHVFNLHLGLRQDERRRQLVRFLGSHPFAHMHARTPVIVAGDFNDVYGTLGARLLVPAGFRAMPSAPNTFPAYAPLRPLDAFFVRGDVQIRRVARGEISMARRASDHLPLVVDLELANA
ncbi:endonuclease/exonuclease/phosphatase family protein [Paraliomyxa miuraensis]|uniref:endonuclease/exonuclease/phosphatase family protein n=1 Tax=Paraliomyxa miuraensis TaxID=376150 RepID=UPI00224E018B|nr:endonuclease/exonuclease/phosphatase family protein [Paraliomyxa miuraensis]MCX4242383.1 endonuclease/exonuclease/phosphatase family protein [Paraliomyxa miuraensis]